MPLTESEQLVKESIKRGDKKEAIQMEESFRFFELLQNYHRITVKDLKKLREIIDSMIAVLEKIDKEGC